MAQVILFGGGDGGGLIITPHGIKPIPPFDPAILHQLRALNNLVRASRIMPEKSAAKILGAIIGKLTTVVLSQIENIVGEIDAENGLIYQDDDGGFSCGSTGRPPIPFPWPVNPRRTVEELFDRGILNEPTLTFLEQAARNKVDVFAAAKNPAAAAAKIGANLTPEIEQTLKSLNLEKEANASGADREVIDFYRRTVTDGRYINEWLINPEGVSKKLNVKLSSEALARIAATRDAGTAGLRDFGSVMSPYAVAVAIAIVIVVADNEFDLPVLDRSGIRKL